MLPRELEREQDLIELCMADPLVKEGMALQSILNKEKSYHNGLHSMDVTRAALGLALSAIPAELEEMLQEDEEETASLQPPKSPWPLSYTRELRLFPSDAKRVVSSNHALITANGRLNYSGLILLAIASAGHDNGYTTTVGYKAEGHEIESVRIVVDRLLQAKYGMLNAYRAAFAILSTQLLPDGEGNFYHVRPFGILARFLQDADVANFGREDFFDQSEAVFKERKDVRQTKEEFDRFTLNKLLKPHHWATPTARRLLDPQKQRNMQELATWTSP